MLPLRMWRSKFRSRLVFLGIFFEFLSWSLGDARIWPGGMSSRAAAEDPVDRPLSLRFSFPSGLMIPARRLSTFRCLFFSGAALLITTFVPGTMPTGFLLRLCGYILLDFFFELATPALLTNPMLCYVHQFCSDSAAILLGFC